MTLRENKMLLYLQLKELFSRHHDNHFIRLKDLVSCSEGKHNVLGENWRDQRPDTITYILSTDFISSSSLKRILE
jgi:hypothetical protein